MTAKKLKGTARVTVVTSTGGPSRYVQFELRDEASRTSPVVIELPFEAWGAIVTAHMDVPVTFEWRPERVGMRREVKTECVQMPRAPISPQLAAREALAEYERDGWTGRIEDATNPHRRVAGHDNAYTVTFVRWVSEEQAKQQEQEHG